MNGVDSVLRPISSPKVPIIYSHYTQGSLTLFHSVEAQKQLQVI